MTRCMHASVLMCSTTNVDLVSWLRPLRAEVIQGIAPAELAKALKGRVVKDALRKGKNLWLELDEGPALM